MTPPLRAPGVAYEGAGRQVAVELRGFSSAIVASDDIIAAAHAAIGIALAESEHRLVMIADLAGDTAPLQSLIRDERPHGIYDSFEFGTSFGKIARQVEGAEKLLIMPGGTDSPATEEIVASPRWSDFASEFAKADELLLIVVPADAPGLAELASHVDGVVLVGMTRLESVPVANILADIPHPAILPPPKIDIAPKRRGLSPLLLGLGAVALLALGITGGAFVGRTRKAVPLPLPPPVDTAVVGSVKPVEPVILPVNPADSADATAYSIEISLSNTLEGANFEIQRHGSVMPAVTISIVPIGQTETTWYRVHAGAYTDSADAERLLATLRRRRVVTDSLVRVVRTPLSMLIDSIAPRAGMTSRVRERIQGLAAQNVNAYALIQRDGSARVYAGAFENPQQSSLAMTALRIAGLTPVLAYRTGRLP